MTTTRLVLLHGVGLDHTMWDAVRALLPADVDVVAPDLLGHGARQAAPAGVTLADLAGDVAEQINPGAHVVGFSLGALVAQHLARFRSDLVATVTSVSSVCRRTEAERTAVLERLRIAESDPATSTKASLARWFEGTAVPDEQVRRTEAVLRANDPASFLACYRVFATADADIAPELPRIDIPALAVTGADDLGSTPEMTQRLADAIPGCRSVVIPGARHMLPIQRPRELVDCVSAFLKESAHV
ncbi:alpha/beta fold hydrolase [Mycobacterium sp. URHB0044]|uniref:alpha/beta fold hydrolase n=1 Tax=Mycobacterium sp. URHB0044 TaxID=1380386 RepID=UPI00048D2562|nr:alpha/beta fold hydrolase [Mycobacterium sp. URHB0044]